MYNNLHLIVRKKIKTVEELFQINLGIIVLTALLNLTLKHIFKIKNKF